MSELQNQPQPTPTPHPLNYHGPEGAQAAAPRSQLGRRTLDGTIKVFIAEALILPTGLVTAVFLTYKLNAGGYGLFTLAAMIVAWIQWSITSVFTRATIKFTAEAERGGDWKPVGTTVVQVHLWTSCIAAALLFASAGLIADALREPTLATYLRIFSLDIPLFCLAQAHRHILVGLGGFTQRAIGAASRWIVRLILIVLLVQLGMSIEGAIWGSIGASLVELCVYRWYARVPVLKRSTFAVRHLWGYAVPLFLMALSLRLFDKLDLLMLKVLDGTKEQAGCYGAAQNLAIIPGIFAMSFSPLLLSTLTRVMHAGDHAHARDMARDSLRGGLLLLPAAGMVAGCADEVIGLIFPKDFADASGPLALLIFAAIGMLIISVGTAILQAGGRPRWTFALTGPMVLMAIAGHYFAIPRLGMNGAAAVTTAVSAAAAMATLMAVYSMWRILPPLASVVRAVVLTSCAFLISDMWPAPHAWLLLKIPVICALVAVVYFLFGEFDAREIALARSLVRVPGWPFGGARKVGEASR